MAKNETSYDLIIIGSGPGGYVAAVRASQLGMKTACIERYPRLGGVCLNVGCIPSKALLDSSEYFHLAKTHFKDHGIVAGEVKLDLETMMGRKDQVVKDLTDNVRKLLEGNKVDILHGRAKLAGEDSVELEGEDGKTTLSAKHILLATGSEPVSPPGLDFDGERIVSSTETLAFDAVPEHLGVVGGGYIGLELGSVWRRLGSEVTVIEMLPAITPTLDGQVARTLKRILDKQGLNFRMKTKVTGAEVDDKGVNLSLDADG